MKFQMNPNEMVVKAGDSSRLIDGFSIKGKLILTTQRIFFKSQTYVNNGNDLEIYPEEINEVLLFNERLIFPSGINIVTKDGKENKFLVKKRAGWNEMIVRMC